MTTKSLEELLAEGDEWFDKLYTSRSPVYYQITARRPNNAPEFAPKDVLVRLEQNGKQRFDDFDAAVDLVAGGN
jgi:hypothetical protein